MLAHFYKEDKFVPMCYIQPKLDGLRALFQNGNFVSRTNKIWEPQILAHIRDELRDVPEGLILDCELYAHGLKLQEINSRVNVRGKRVHPDIKDIQLHVFDTVAKTPFFDRYTSVMKYIAGKHYVRHVPTHLVQCTEQADQLYNYYRNQGYEGIMYRHPTDGYSLPWECSRKDNRCWSLMKRKGGFDLSDCQIISVEEGEGKYFNTAGFLWIRHDEVPRPFKVGSGISDLERDILWNNRDKLDGCTVDIRFDEYSSDDIPQRLRIELLHLSDELNNI